MMKFETGNTPELHGDCKGFSVSASPAASFWEGVFSVNKPVGVTSFRVVQLVRRLTGIKKVGHTGTLDPFASGVLVVCVGRPATRLISQLMDGDKEYEAILQLGITTETQDPEGQIVEKRPVPEITEKKIEQCLAQFRGEHLQTPPVYSALKHKGKPLYYYARKGIKVTKAPRLIEIKELECLSLERDSLALKVVCSKGTYIRALAADIGEFLGCGAHLRELKRTRNGLFSLGESLPGEQLFTEDTGRSSLLSHRIGVEKVKELLAGTTENN
jgi:tRNA pseudouridine55 synthase